MAAVALGKIVGGVAALAETPAIMIHLLFRPWLFGAVAVAHRLHQIRAVHLRVVIVGAVSAAAVAVLTAVGQVGIGSSIADLGMRIADFRNVE